MFGGTKWCSLVAGFGFGEARLRTFSGSFDPSQSWNARLGFGLGSRGPDDHFTLTCVVGSERPNVVDLSFGR